MSAEQLPPSGRWKSGGVTTAEPGVGGGDTCGAGALQAASAKAAKASGASDFIGGPPTPRCVPRAIRSQERPAPRDPPRRHEFRVVFRATPYLMLRGSLS